MRTRKPVGQGGMRERVEIPVGSVADEALGWTEQHALDLGESALDAMLHRAVRKALEDASPAIPAGRVFEDLWLFHAERLNAAGRA
ncbi:hypothetical protein [Methylobacterium frigidaeris]|uniref:Uncharacterized protein n=2 Tax=Methylobacterium frigidaeris TaxID=2038277 RepID=A0AA37HI05_9HYPH|nr:hypothetical protein [Methylobacterium frigidaeris]PIK69748.1 hypothetical protein CS379_28255 [Methylobacterium frigidaeris]GJD66164.1 hypothetical protein MPEAHAMD_6361 [Methylobacterium frigidaeris]